MGVKNLVWDRQYWVLTEFRLRVRYGTGLRQKLPENTDINNVSTTKTKFDQHCL